MSRKLTAEELARFFAKDPAWKGDEAEIRKTYTFAGYPQALAFTVSVAVVAEKRDHHPDILLSWGKVEVRWTTHDAGGVSGLDVELAEATDALYLTAPGATSRS